MGILNKKISYNRGMTYIELIVVLSIFAVLSGTAVYNHGIFQSKVEIKTLASDMALKIVESQKSSLSGKLPPLSQQSQIDSTWKPSYGVYINPSSDNKSFVYFVDLKNPAQNGLYNTSTCPGSGECLERITITKGNSISALNVFYQGDTNAYNLGDLTVTFKRPNSTPVIKSSTAFTSTINYIQITVISPKAQIAKIKLYPSGRVQIN